MVNKDRYYWNRLAEFIYLYKNANIIETSQNSRNKVDWVHIYLYKDKMRILLKQADIVVMGWLGST